MATIQDVITNLQNVGIFEFFLPFILIFAAVFGMLQKTQIFGKPKEDAGVTKINAVISFAFAAFIMVYPTTSGVVFDLTEYLANFVGGTLIYIFGIIVAMMLFVMISTPLNKGETPAITKAATIGGVVAVVLVIALFFASGGAEIFPGISTNLGYTLTPVSFGGIDPSVIALAIVLIVIILAIWWLTKGS